jgi:hypothetical protein
MTCSPMHRFTHEEYKLRADRSLGTEFVSCNENMKVIRKFSLISRLWKIVIWFCSIFYTEQKESLWILLWEFSSIIIQFNSISFVCRVNIYKANYRHSTSVGTSNNIMNKHYIKTKVYGSIYGMQSTQQYSVMLCLCHRFSDIACSCDAPCLVANSWDITDVKGGKSVIFLVGTRKPTVNFVLENVNKK